ncbi:MAG: MFS transporter [Alphaproteobacteria bacterium]|nr:MFS transporter [Alphaproteobacteria bacterium]
MPAANLPDPMMSYLWFLRDNWRFVGFGFIMSASSSFGQTFYIALSGADIRAEFGLTHGGFGSWFAVATIVSAATLVWLGRMIDRVDLRWYTVAACSGLILSMLVIAAAPTIAILVVGLYLARLTGQGLMIHISNTSMGRYFDADRGKAVSVAAMGQSLGEAVLPAIVVVLIVQIGWRGAWFAAAAVVAGALAVLVPWLMRGYGERHRTHLERVERRPSQSKVSGAQWTRGEVLRDRRFYVVVAAVLSFSFIGTGLFFHQVHIANVKGWPLELLASAFVLFAVLKVVTSLAVGTLVDRFGSVALLPVMLAPLAATLIAIAVSDAAIVPFVYLGFLGVGVGVLMPVMGSLWPELYGVVHLGAIRAMMAALLVLSSAMSPAVFGLLLDAGVSIETISLFCLVYVAASGGIAAWTFRGYSRSVDRQP